MKFKCFFASCFARLVLLLLSPSMVVNDLKILFQISTYAVLNAE